MLAARAVEEQVAVSNEVGENLLRRDFGARNSLQSRLVVCRPPTKKTSRGTPSIPANRAAYADVRPTNSRSFARACAIFKTH